MEVKPRNQSSFVPKKLNLRETILYFSYRMMQQWVDLLIVSKEEEFRDIEIHALLEIWAKYVATDRNYFK